MKISALFFILLTPVLPAQPPQLLLSRFPYLPESPTPLPLDWRSMLAEIPAPVFQSNSLVFPDELQFTAEELKWVRNLREGYQAVQEQNFTRALEVFRDFLSVYPDHLPTRLALADVLFSVKEYAAAEQAYREVLTAAPQQFQALNNLAWLYANSTEPERRKPEQSLNLARQALLVEPGSHHVWSTLSQAYYALGLFREAAEAANRAIQLSQQTKAPDIVQVNYILQLDRCRNAWLATSFLD